MNARHLTASIVVVALLTGCADSPFGPSSSRSFGAPALSQGSNSGGVNSGGGSGGSGGGGGGGGGGGNGGNNVLPPPSVPPAVVVGGTYVTTVIGGVPAGVSRTITMTISQSVAGYVTGTIANRQIDGTLEPFEGTVSGNTVDLYIGNVCGSCTLSPIFHGSSSDGVSISGDLFVLSWTPTTFTK